jgi:hypothetical protein
MGNMLEREAIPDWTSWAGVSGIFAGKDVDLLMFSYSA